MESTFYRTKEELLLRAQAVCGIPLRKIDRSGRLATGKGAVGTVIEEGWFGYQPNAESEPDFPEAGVELKVTPYVRNGGELRAKERLVCNIINYMEECGRTFQTSAFWHKCNTMLLLSYEHRAEIPKGDYTIDKAVLFSFPEEDLAILERDWETIMSKVRAGQAHLISEGDTLYLAACTKGASAESMRRQPFSDIPAKQRAYALKASYMTRILNTYIFGSAPCERIIKDWRVLQRISLEAFVDQKLRPYYGLRREQLAERLGVVYDSARPPKNLNEVLLAKMLGIRGKLAYTEEFQKAGIVPKTIRVQRDGAIRESMSFPAFDFQALCRETWEGSALRSYLAPARFLFILFQEDADGTYRFGGARFWNIPETDLEEVRRVWEETVRRIREGVRLTVCGGRVENNLPGLRDSPVAHVRPHTRRSFYVLGDGTRLGSGGYGDASQLPDGRWMTKQSFWLNRSYLQSQLEMGAGGPYNGPQK